MRTAWILTSALLLTACSGDEPGPAGPETRVSSTAGSSDQGPSDSTTAGAGSDSGGTNGSSQGGSSDIASRTSDLQWKRYATFEADLAGALELSRDALCREFGEAPCIRAVHLTPLGGNEPFESGLLKPSQEPLATTPTVVDRIVLAACSRRADLDAADGGGVFGSALDLADSAPEASSAAVHSVVTDLYRRLLARDPSDEEIEVIGGLTRDESGAPVAAVDFAKAACFAIGTTTEFLFF